MGIFSFLTGNKTKRIQDFKERGALVIDVRSKEEFRSGHLKGARNMPLAGIAGRVKELQKLQKPLLLCCASGMRSGQATQILKGHGLECLNGGGWRSLQRHF